MNSQNFHISHAALQDIATTVLQAGNDLRFQAHGNSMAPFIRDGDTIHLRNRASYNRGDVVLLTNDQVLLVHRIVRKDQHGVITRGDACTHDDPGPVDIAEILGKVYKVSGSGYNYHLHPPVSRLLAMPFFARHVFRNRFVRTIGKILSPLIG